MKDTEEARLYWYNAGLSDGKIALKLFGDKSKSRVIQKWRTRRGLKTKYKPIQKEREIQQEAENLSWCERLRQNGAEGFYRDLVIYRKSYSGRPLKPQRREIFWPFPVVG